MRRITTLIAWCLASTASATSIEVSIVGESASGLGRPRLFIASRDPQTLSGDVVARYVDGDAPQANALWSASRMLQNRSSTQTTSRHVVATGAPASLLEQLRATALGEIRNANLWFTARRTSMESASTRPAMVYTGAADGMLHGFDAADGNERIAYVPGALLQQLMQATAGQASPTVDGPLFTGEARPVFDGPVVTFLVGALGAGGKGFFVLDVTDPAQFTAMSATTVHTDLTRAADDDIGHIYGAPVVDEADPNRSRQIVRLNDGRWAVVMGNGYFSPAGRPVLLVQYLDAQNRDPVTGAPELRKLSPCQDRLPCAFQGDNGLAAPRLVDVDGNGTVDIAYAGDLRGNLWKFDLTGRNDLGTPASVWRVAFQNQPLFVARSADKRPQAFTTAPYVVAHPRGGFMLVVGTGRHLQATDTADVAVQTIYGLYDDSSMTVGDGQVRLRDTVPLNSLGAEAARPATLVAQRYSGTRTDGIRLYHEANHEALRYEGTEPHRGWYLDLPLGGQRVLQHPRGFEGHKVLVYSVVPDGSGTWLAGDSHVSVVQAITGQAPRQPAFQPEGADVAVDGIGMASLPAGPTWGVRLRGRLRLHHGGQGWLDLHGGSTTGQRAGWREHQ